MFVLYEYDGRFDNEDEPLLDRAVYSVTASGHSRYQHRFIERDTTGTLRRRPSPPPARRRLRWRLFRHRPRLWRFWLVEHKTNTYNVIERGRSNLLYLGRRDNGKTPLLVLGLVRGDQPRSLVVELTWYPSNGFERSAPRELLKLTPDTHLASRLRVWANIVVWPGRIYNFQAAYQVRPDGC